MVAHNATFDVGFMNMNYQRNGLPIIKQPVVDTLEFARNLYPEMKRFGLGQLTKKFQIGLEHHHMANYDAEATDVYCLSSLMKFAIVLAGHHCLT